MIAVEDQTDTRATSSHQPLRHRDSCLAGPVPGRVTWRHHKCDCHQEDRTGTVMTSVGHGVFDWTRVNVGVGFATVSLDCWEIGHGQHLTVWAFGC